MKNTILFGIWNGTSLVKGLTLKNVAILEGEVVRYTGVKNIYEGDIIKGRNDRGNKDDRYLPTAVVFYKGRFCCEYWHLDLNDECEVIGNIFQDPDLLKI